ncbi:hypothetical protein GCM10009828_008590 [Actinoplanes couchii]
MIPPAAPTRWTLWHRKLSWLLLGIYGPVRVEASYQPERFPCIQFCMRAGPTGNPCRRPPCADPGSTVPGAGRIGKQMSLDGRPDFIREVHHQGLGQVTTQPPGPVYMPCCGLLKCGT